MIYYNFSLIYCYSCLIYYVLNVLFITKKHKIFDSIQYLFITIHNIFICICIISTVIILDTKSS